ncbi:aldolase [Leifsonia sp. Leaf336]|uniref:HpcH/HpaI aldolase/citrate lyase family protein n=1 Tax=Leifsonia sp. Leaf336 TaxID=1736341 RepID=UPI000700FA3F|nr:aldolase/citrate lyase family protein [Leifsonia sp. Leaf336]KQR52337.1 aldolase [Leifsonia sp. Leaf336]
MTLQLDTPSRPGFGVPADVARTWLLISAARLDAVAVSGSRADAVVIDLEDAIDASRKGVERERVARFLETGGEAWVRINDRTTPFWADDLDRLRGAPGLLGVVLAKTEEAGHVAETSERLGGGTPVVALIESALGIENAAAIARAAGVFRLAFGSGDYRRDTGVANNELALAYPRSRLVVASRVGSLPGPIDGPSVVDGVPIVTEQSRSASALGLTGRLCLREAQVAIVNEVMAPSAEEVSWASDFLEEFDACGRVVRDGSDLPRLGRAERILELDRAFSSAPNSTPSPTRM